MLLQNPILNIYIYSNGTIIPNTSLINIICKYPKKIYFWLSNYTKNYDLLPILKDNEILKLLKQHNINYIFDESFMWLKTSMPISNHRTREQNRKLYEFCLHPCVSMIKGKISPCPRASTYLIENMCNINNSECFDVRDSSVTKHQLFEWYSRNYFSVCDLCNFHDDVKKPPVIPAIQVKKL